MSTIIQSKKTLLTVVVGTAVAAVLVLGSFAAPAQALTQEQIDSILGLLESFGADEATMSNVEAALTGEEAPTPDPTPTPTPVEELFTRDVSVGSSGAEVKRLQQWLNDNGYTVASSGAGSPGNETEYFGELTRQAVAAYQAANNIEPTAGYFGPKTRAAVNAEIESVDPVNDEPVNDEPANDEPVNDEPEVGREGTISAERRGDYRNVEVGMAQTRNVATYRIEADDSRVDVQRIDIYVGGDNDLKDLRSEIDHMALKVGGETVAETPINRSTIGRDDDYIRFGGLSINVPRDGHTDFTIEVTVADEESPDPDEFEIGPISGSESQGAIRGVDTAGINIYADADATNFVSFELTGDVEGELEASRNANTPDEGLVVIDEGSWEEVHLLSFDIEVSEDDVDLEDITVTLTETVTDGDWGDIEVYVQDLILKEGNTVLETVSATSGENEFIDLGLELAEGEVVTMDVYAEVRIDDEELENQGFALKAEVLADENEEIGYDMMDNDVHLSGNARGYNQGIYIVAPSAQLSASSIVRSGENNEYGEASMSIDVTAVGGDIYFTEEGLQFVDQGEDSGEWDVNYDLSNLDEQDDLNELYGGSYDGDSDLAATTTVYLLEEGETETVSFNAEIEDADAWVSLKVENIWWWTVDESGSAFEFLFTDDMEDVDALETDEVRVRDSV